MSVCYHTLPVQLDSLEIFWHRYKSGFLLGTTPEDPTPDYMNVLSMLFSMCGLMVRFSGNEIVLIILTCFCLF